MVCEGKPLPVHRRVFFFLCYLYVEGRVAVGSADFVVVLLVIVIGCLTLWALYVCSVHHVIYIYIYIYIYIHIHTYAYRLLCKVCTCVCECLFVCVWERASQGYLEKFFT